MSARPPTESPSAVAPPLDGRGAIARMRAAAREGWRDLVALAFRFGLVGVVKTALDFAMFNLVLLLSGSPGGVTALLANTAGFTVAVAAGFVLHARYAFRVVAQRGGFARYVLVSAVGLAVYNGSLAIVIYATGAESLLALNAAKVAALFASLAWNLVGYWRFVFRSSQPRG